MRFLIFLIFASAQFAAIPDSSGQAPSTAKTPGTPLRAAVVGLVHGHAAGFFERNLHRPDLRIVGVSEPDRQLAAARQPLPTGSKPAVYESGGDAAEDAPQAVLVYTNSFDHRKVVEICARRGVHVMMEKPFAVSMKDARAIELAARQGKIEVLVNYETHVVSQQPGSLRSRCAHHRF